MGMCKFHVILSNKANSSCWCHRWIWALFCFFFSIRKEKNQERKSYLTDIFTELNFWFLFLLPYPLIVGLDNYLLETICVSFSTRFFVSRLLRKQHSFQLA